MSERELSGVVDSNCASLVPDEVNSLWFRDGGSTFPTSTPAPATWPAFKASANASSSMIPSRAVMMRYAFGRIDGRLSPRTEAALRQFQAANGMAVTGRVDRETLVGLDHGWRTDGICDADGHGLGAAPERTSEEAVFEPF